MRWKSGFSVLELLAVVAVVAILAALGFSGMPRDRLAVQQAAQGLVNDAQAARYQAITRNTYVELDIRAAEDSYLVLERDSGVAIKTVVIGGDDRTQRARIAGVDVDANNLVFDPRGVGIGLGPQRVTFASTSSDYTQTVAFSQQGRASIE